MVKFYKDGDRMGVVTDCKNRDNFISHAATELGNIIDTRIFANDWEFQLSYWLEHICDIAESYTSEKSLVKETTIRKTGHTDESFRVN